jgi:hypothetical protein|tara:strand:+ start:750 stop:1115 length:366 start_codon:yes stop_codon:yes gene_type:complete
MPKLKRDIVKYVRDKAKSRYKKGTECHICGSKTKLDFHHFYSLTGLLNKWLKDNNFNPQYIQALREDFIEEHNAELYEHAVTLCNMHHKQLHSIYGKEPSLLTAEKQRNWVEIQRQKNGLV